VKRRLPKERDDQLALFKRRGPSDLSHAAGPPSWGARRGAVESQEGPKGKKKIRVASDRLRRVDGLGKKTLKWGGEISVEQALWGLNLLRGDVRLERSKKRWADKTSLNQDGEKETMEEKGGERNREGEGPNTITKPHGENSRLVVWERRISRARSYLVAGTSFNRASSQSSEEHRQYREKRKYILPPRYDCKKDKSLEGRKGAINWRSILPRGALTTLRGL